MALSSLMGVLGGKRLSCADKVKRITGLSVELDRPDILWLDLLNKALLQREAIAYGPACIASLERSVCHHWCLNYAGNRSGLNTIALT